MASQQDQVVQKASFNIYTMMLIISLMCLIVGCSLLYAELQLYGEYPWWRTGASTSWVPSPTSLVARS